METLTKIPFSLEPEQLMAQAHIEAGCSDARDLLALIDLGRQVGRPKAAYAACFITSRDGDNVQIDGVWFSSRTLARNLEPVERVFVSVATCGRELDEAFPARGDILQEFWLDLIKTHLLGAANKYLRDTLHRRFQLGKTASMAPGSGDANVWPIEQQRPLFTLLGNVEEAIGVRLTESCLMMPNKTVSGLLFATEKDFRSCEVCHREDCPSRQTAFNPELWEALYHE